MDSCKSLKSSHALDRGTRSASIDECLPQEMLEAILEKGGRGTLCTARLVSRTFCAAASANISSLTMRNPSQVVSLGRFPRLGHVRVHLSVKDCSPAQLDPHLRAVMTQLIVSHGEDRVRCLTLPELPGMPKLRELEVDPDVHVDGAAVLHRLTNLEVLRIDDCSPSVAMTITAMTWLTSLVIGRVTRPGEGWESADFSWLHHATNLRLLRALHITVSQEALPLIGNLTGLTGLTWVAGIDDMSDTDSIAPLSPLSRLRSLSMPGCISDSELATACSLGLGSLANLSVCVGECASADGGRLLARQTALTQLAVGWVQPFNLRHMGALRIELLQSLELWGLGDVDVEGLDVLQKATSLTKLGITTCVERPDLGLSYTLGRLTQLRCLQLRMRGECVLNLPLALGPLTALTKLQLTKTEDNGRLENGDLRALLGLTGLQVLDLESCRLTDDMVVELGVLTNLRKLRLFCCGVTSLAPATNILNPFREARGWPPVDADCWTHQPFASVCG